MTIETTYSQARAELASLMSRITDDREVVIVTRRDHAPVAMIAADELASLLETAHLLRSPANAKRLLESLARARTRSADSSKPAPPQRAARRSVAALREEVGLDPQ
jgi:antitoxin YefM